MNFDNIPSAFTLPLRLAIISTLISGEKSFMELKQITKSTDGNLNVQLINLKNDNFIISNNTKKNTTIYSITSFGIKSFTEYIDFLERILLESKLS